MMASLKFAAILFPSFLLFLSYVNVTLGKRLKDHVPHNYLPENWRTFLLYEGCFELNGTPEKERNHPQNNNYICNDFCDREGKNFSATIGERCLCFSRLPTTRLAKDQCDTICPQLQPGDEEDGSSGCKDFGCCGSVSSNAVTVIQTIKVRDQNNKKKDHPTHTHATTSSDGDGFGNVIVHEGCFKKSENPAKERTDPQNVNVVCINFCVQENINYAATISDRCLCLNNLPTEQLDEDQCSTPCPGYGYEEGTSCQGFGCCGSVTNDAVSIYQSVSSDFDKGAKKTSKTKRTN